MTDNGTGVRECVLGRVYDIFIFSVSFTRRFRKSKKKKKNDIESIAVGTRKNDRTSAAGSFVIAASARKHISSLLQTSLAGSRACESEIDNTAEGHLSVDLNDCRPV